MKALLICLLILSIFFVFKFNYLPPQLPLFYSLPEGENQLVDWWHIFLIPLMMVFFYFINRYVQIKFFSEEKFMIKIIEIFNFVIIIILTLIFLRVIFLVT